MINKNLNFVWYTVLLIAMYGLFACTEKEKISAENPALDPDESDSVDLEPLDLKVVPTAGIDFLYSLKDTFYFDQEMTIINVTLHNTTEDTIYSLSSTGGCSFYHDSVMIDCFSPVNFNVNRRVISRLLPHEKRVFKDFLIGSMKTHQAPISMKRISVNRYYPVETCIEHSKEFDQFNYAKYEKERMILGKRK